MKAAARSSQVKKKAKIQGTKNLVPENTQSEEPAVLPSHTATVQAIVGGISSDRNLPPAHVSLVSSTPAALPEHYVLYKSTAAAEMEGWNDENGHVRISRYVLSETFISLSSLSLLETLGQTAQSLSDF